LADPYGFAADAEAVVLVPALVVAYVVLTRIFPVSRARAWAFAGGIVLILAVFVTPVQPIALHYLLAAHLLQNVVLAEWAPALLVLALPPTLAAEAGQLPVVRALTRPVVALPLWLAVYFAWHVPWAYDAALRRPETLLHLEHLSYLAAGVLLWWPVVHRAPHALAAGAKAVYLFAAFVLASPIGLMLALLPHAVYTTYKNGPGLWGLGPDTDQQLAGLTMAAEQAVVFFAVFAAFFLRFLREEEARGQLDGARP
jgi:cytochrome c oxidase assembly factor CtaG